MAEKKEVKRDKVCIVGFAPDSRNMVENYYDKPDFEIWALNELYIEMPNLEARATAWFQLHGYEPPTQRDPDHKQRLALMDKNNIPVYMWKKHNEIPNSVAYPRNSILKQFDVYGEGMCPERAHERERVYFTNSISWMLALAIQKKFKEIHIAGVNMAQDQEYQHQRPSCEMFVGWARGMGIKVYLPTASDLCMAWGLYGYDEGSAFQIKMNSRIAELNQRINNIRNGRLQHSNEATNLLSQENQLIGALEDVKYMINLGPQGVASETVVGGNNEIPNQ